MTTSPVSPQQKRETRFEELFIMAKKKQKKHGKTTDKWTLTYPQTISPEII